MIPCWFSYSDTCHDVFQLVQALVDAGPPLAFQQGLGDLLVRVRSREGHVRVARASGGAAQLQLGGEGDVKNVSGITTKIIIATPPTCSGEESVDGEESNVVEETLGVKAETENGLCTVCQFITKPSSLSFT